MTSFKFIAAIFCAFLIFQAQASPLDSEVEVKDGILDTVKKVVKQVESVIDILLSLAVKELEKIDSNIENVRVNATVIFDKIVDRVAARVEKVFARVEEDGDENVKIVVKCVLGGHNRLIGFIKTLFDTTTACGSADLVKIVESIKPIIGDLEKTQIDVKAAADNIDDCTDLSCTIKVATEVLAVVKGIPDVVRADFRAAIEVIKVALVDTHNSCLKPFVFDLRKEVVEIGNEIGTCTRA